MRIIFAVVIVGCLVVVSEPGSGQGLLKLSASDFFKYPDRSAYRISPKGDWLAYLKPTGHPRRLNIFVRRVDDNDSDEKCLTTETKDDILYYFWKGNNRVIYSIGSHIYSVDNLQQPQITDLTTRPNLRISSIVDTLDASDDDLLVQFATARNESPDVYKLNLVQGVGPGGAAPAARLPQPSQYTGSIARWIADPDGTVRAAIGSDGVGINLLAPDQNGFRVVKTWDFREAIDQNEQIEVFGTKLRGSLPSPERRQLYYMKQASAAGPKVVSKPVIYALSSAGQRKTKALVMIDVTNGEEIGPALYENKKFDADGMEVFKGKVMCATFADTKPERECWGPAPKTIHQMISEELKLAPDVEIDVMSRDRAERRFTVVLSSATRPFESYLFDSGAKSHRLKLLAKFAPQLEGKLAPVECINYRTRDNKFDIMGYLTTPIGYDGKRRIPLVAIVHGGPGERAVGGFNRENTEAQFFANRGYAVLQINFRGSTGYGTAFWTAGFKQWGGDMQTDVTDGVLWAINERKIADPKRIAIIGESYGGYAALAGLAFTREKDFQYAAAVDRAGISDLVKLMSDYSDDAQLVQMIGDPKNDYDLLAKRSPALQPDQISAPVLVAYGTHDSSVDPKQSTTLVEALHSRHANVQGLPFDDGHIFYREENRIGYYEAVDEFLKKNLGSAAANN